MENSSLKFIHIIYNQDSNNISFVHLGKPSLGARIKYNCRPCNNKRNNYAFTPRTVEEFILFLENTELTPSRNFNDFSFKSFRIKPSRGIEDQIPFNWILTKFGAEYFPSPDEFRIFTRRCNSIKQEKLNKLNGQSNERE